MNLEFGKQNLKVGRDTLFKVLRDNNMLTLRKKYSCRTTNSYHRFYKYNRAANSASTNTAAIQVPVWGYGSGPNGIAASVSTDYINNQTSLMMNCYGSTVASLQLLNLTIEELSTKTVMALKAYAKKNKIELFESKTKIEILENSRDSI